MWENNAAKPEYARAKIAVWWDMKDCPIPEGYDARRVRPSIEGAFKNLGYSGPVSITAYGDQKQTPVHLLRGLSSTGVAVAHTRSESTCSLMFSDMVEWRGHNPPPATMMLISEQVDDVFSWDLVRLQQETKYNLFLAYSVRSQVLVTSAKWRWEKLLGSTAVDKHEEIISAMFYCKSCNFDYQSLGKFRKHLSSKEHAWEEVRNPKARELAPVTREWGRNYPAKPEYARAKIAVWWDMKDCPIPEGYDARRVRPSIQGAFKELGYSGPVSITAYGDQTQTPCHLLRGLSSTGVAVAHTRSESTCSLMYSDMVEWRGHNPPPATMMIISDQVKDVFSWDLARLQQRTLYNIFLAYSIKSPYASALLTRAEWLWGKLLGSEDNNKIETRLVEDKCTSAMFYCKSCNFDGQSPEKFRKHLSSYNHAREEAINPTYTDLISVTNTWGRNYPAMPKYATAKIAVWWDMFDCPIPEGYDARRVRPSLEAAFKKLGYSGPVSITAYGDLNHTPDHLLRALSSTGVDVAHAIGAVTYKHVHLDCKEWIKHNPHPATWMFILDSVHLGFPWLDHTLQEEKLNLFMAYSFRPCKMSTLVTSAEWLWESLLAETRGHFLQKCSERGESTGMFYCKLCLCDCKSLDSFRTHLSSKEHARQENRITAVFQFSRQEHKLGQLFDYEQTHPREVENSPKSKHMRKAFRTGFRLLDNHLRLTNRGARRRARKS